MAQNPIAEIAHQIIDEADETHDHQATTHAYHDTIEQSLESLPDDHRYEVKICVYYILMRRVGIM